MADTLEEAYRRIGALERELVARSAALDAAGKELDSFSYGISHDLRSPLRAIGGFAQMLEEDCGASLDENGRRYLTVIRASARKLDRQIEGLLEYARLGSQPLNPVQVDMAALAQHALQDVLGESERPQAEIVLHELPAARGDADLLYHVWHNLLDNALKFTGNIAAPRVEIGASRGEGESIWHVRDNGVGFDMRYAPKLFGMFQRLHTEEEFPGVGAGLAIVRRIVMRHGGRVWAEAGCGEGACLSFSLPDEPVV
jgi:light-regulated signal transduction histidine kinase (bacteriophytochrome)